MQTAVLDGLQWSFISLIPWAGLSFFALLFLSEITDLDRAQEEEQETKLVREAYLHKLMKDDGETQQGKG